ncbi:MAG: hypothetical protein K9K86_09875 [Pseudomonadales bacterium]|nr:hypothetical protein [Pseudomonadales bacterium]
MKAIMRVLIDVLLIVIFSIIGASLLARRSIDSYVQKLEEDSKNLYLMVGDVSEKVQTVSNAVDYLGYLKSVEQFKQASIVLSRLESGSLDFTLPIITIRAPVSADAVHAALNRLGDDFFMSENYGSECRDVAIGFIAEVASPPAEGDAGGVGGP